jgi:hypothetical protein
MPSHSPYRSRPHISRLQALKYAWRVGLEAPCQAPPLSREWEAGHSDRDQYNAIYYDGVWAPQDLDISLVRPDRPYPPYPQHLSAAGPTVQHGGDRACHGETWGRPCLPRGGIDAAVHPRTNVPTMTRVRMHPQRR